MTPVAPPTRELLFLLSEINLEHKLLLLLVILEELPILVPHLQLHLLLQQFNYLNLMLEFLLFWTLFKYQQHLMLDPLQPHLVLDLLQLHLQMEAIPPYNSRLEVEFQAVLTQLLFLSVPIRHQEQLQFATKSQLMMSNLEPFSKEN